MARRLVADPARPTSRSNRDRWEGCCRGTYPAEVLSTRDREDLITELHALGWTDVEIAEHCMLSTYTTARIRDRLGITPNQGRRWSPYGADPHDQT